MAWARSQSSASSSSSSSPRPTYAGDRAPVPSRKAKRLQAAEATRTKASGRTHVLGILAGGAVLTVFGAELTRVWRLGTLPRSRQILSEEDRWVKPIEAWMTLLEGYAVSRTRENSLFNMLASFTVAFGITRSITW